MFNAATLKCLETDPTESIDVVILFLHLLWLLLSSTFGITFISMTENLQMSFVGSIGAFFAPV